MLNHDIRFYFILSFEHNLLGKKQQLLTDASMYYSTWQNNQ